jgi:hypothetical protein
LSISGVFSQVKSASSRVEVTVGGGPAEDRPAQDDRVLAGDVRIAQPV